MHSFVKLAKFIIFRISLKKLKKSLGHVAQMDRASDSGSVSRGFESLHARKNLKLVTHYANTVRIQYKTNIF